MLVPVRTSGSKPPLFLVHDQHGIMPFGTGVARVLGSDHPVYAIHASGMDGRQPATNNLPSMVQTYIAEIHGARLMGPLLIGGLGSGSLAAIEIARELQDRGRRVGPVILVDPPPLGGQLQQSPTPDLPAPTIGGPLYQSLRMALVDHASHPGNDLPFEAGNPKQLHLATLAGLAALTAFARCAPQPFAGPTELLLPAERAEQFFHPKMSWHELLPGERIVHVLPWDHGELLKSGLAATIDAVKFLVEEAVEAFADRPPETAAAAG